MFNGLDHLSNIAFNFLRHPKLRSAEIYESKKKNKQLKKYYLLIIKFYKKKELKFVKKIKNICTVLVSFIEHEIFK